jgi:S-(hydroxymethyl)glutathione dehydrogenase / alcohol dehydrogenase
VKAAVLNSIPGTLEIEEVKIDKPGPREVLIRTVAAGLCHSDLHFMEGTYPHKTPVVLGHESAGVVEAVGSDVRYVAPGDHVITCLSVFCGSCEMCLSGRPSLCLNKDIECNRTEGSAPRLSANGKPMEQFLHLSSFGEQMLVHEHAVVKITKDMPLDRAALIGCGITTGLGAIFRTAKVEPGTTVAVLGAGGVGLAAIQGARIAGANKIIAVDLQDSKLEMASQMGATHTVNAGDGDAVANVLEMTGGGVDYSFEAIGLKMTAEQSFKMLRKGGSATIIGMIPVGTMIEVHGMDLCFGERVLQGSNMGSNQFRTDMPRFIDMYLDGRLFIDEMLSAHIGLEDINEGFEAMKRGEVARSVITFD